MIHYVVNARSGARRSHGGGEDAQRGALVAKGVGGGRADGARGRDDRGAATRSRRGSRAPRVCAGSHAGCHGGRGTRFGSPPRAVRRAADDRFPRGRRLRAGGRRVDGGGHPDARSRGVPAGDDGDQQRGRSLPPRLGAGRRAGQGAHRPRARARFGARRRGGGAAGRDGATAHRAARHATGRRHGRRPARQGPEARPRRGTDAAAPRGLVGGQRRRRLGRTAQPPGRRGRRPGRGRVPVRRAGDFRNASHMRSEVRRYHSGAGYIRSVVGIRAAYRDAEALPTTVSVLAREEGVDVEVAPDAVPTSADPSFVAGNPFHPEPSSPPTSTSPSRLRPPRSIRARPSTPATARVPARARLPAPARPPLALRVRAQPRPPARAPPRSRAGCADCDPADDGPSPTGGPGPVLDPSSPSADESVGGDRPESSPARPLRSPPPLPLGAVWIWWRRARPRPSDVGGSPTV